MVDESVFAILYFLAYMGFALGFLVCLVDAIRASSTSLEALVAFLRQMRSWLIFYVLALLILFALVWGGFAGYRLLSTIVL